MVKKDNFDAMLKAVGQSLTKQYDNGSKPYHTIHEALGLIEHEVWKLKAAISRYDIDAITSQMMRVVVSAAWAMIGEDDPLPFTPAEADKIFNILSDNYAFLSKLEAMPSMSEDTIVQINNILARSAEVMPTDKPQTLVKYILNTTLQSFAISPLAFDRVKQIVPEEADNILWTDISSRCHPALLQVVDELGLDLSAGPGCIFKIVEVPAGVPIVLDSDDCGIECLAEKHRTWR